MDDQRSNNYMQHKETEGVIVNELPGGMGLETKSMCLLSSLVFKEVRFSVWLCFGKETSSAEDLCSIV